MIRRKLFLGGLICAMVGMVLSCNKKQDNEVTTSAGDVTLDSITIHPRTIRGYDTTYVRAYVTGENLVYSWEADHGTLTAMGNGDSICYWAGLCCIGDNTIRCTVTDGSHEVTDTVRVHVKP